MSGVSGDRPYQRSCRWSRRVMVAVALVAGGLLAHAGAAHADMVTLGQFDAMAAKKDAGSQQERVMHGMYLIALTDGLIAANVIAQAKRGTQLFCLPRGIALTPEQLRKQLRIYRKARKPDGKTPVALTAGLAVAEAFPC